MKASFGVVAVLSVAGCAAAGAGTVPGQRSATAAQEAEAEYRPEQLPILSRVIVSVNDDYVDPSRIDPRRMLLAALVGVERAVPEFVVQGKATSRALTLTVRSSSRELDIARVDTIWKIRTAMGDAMEFVREHLAGKHELMDIELAAVNGMVSALDPHTLLLDPRQFRAMGGPVPRGPQLGAAGFVFATRDGKLTVVKVLKGTPAHRAGVRPHDILTEIDGAPTDHMTLADAVDRMRGAVQSKVSIAVMRAGWTEPRRFQLVREVVWVESISHAKLLQGGIGYVKLDRFNKTAAAELRATLGALATEAGGRLRGLVLDLRGNSGGLFEQALEVSDLFLAQGVIAKTVGGGVKRRIYEVKEAYADGSELERLPLAVLVNGITASGAEIVASALRENGRALVAGRRTFGMDSIQVLQTFALPGREGDEAALKLTIARFFTPGDTSVQELGITPDVLLRPAVATRQRVSCFAPPRAPGEASLAAHFANPSPPAAVGAPLELRYLLETKEDDDAKARDGRRPHGGVDLTPEQQEDEGADAEPDLLVEDEPIRFARELLARAPYADRARLLEGARTLVAQRGDEESARLARRLGELGVDWTASAAQGAARAVVTIAPPEHRDHRAGDAVDWTVTVENRGDAPLRRLRAWTRAERNPLIDRREFVFGTVKPGQRRSWTVPVSVPSDTLSRRDEVTLHFEDEGGRAPPDVVTSFGVVEAPGAAAKPEEPPRREPPRIACTPDPGRGAPVVDGDTLRLQGRVSPAAAGAKLRDVQVLVEDRKVFFKETGDSPDGSLAFEAVVPLEPGSNLVTVVARAEGDLVGRRSFVVLRRPAGAAR
jgi:carboxyl-terminal processing protease